MQGRQADYVKLRNPGDGRLFTSGFEAPFPLEPELQKELDEEQETKVR
jgi:hypothetical protein